jgi:cell division septal protein FtsQ
MSKESENTQVKTPVWTPELLQQRRKRAAIMAVALLAFVGLFFWVTLVKLGVNVTNRPL